MLEPICIGNFIKLSTCHTFSDLQCASMCSSCCILLLANCSSNLILYWAFNWSFEKKYSYFKYLTQTVLNITPWLKITFLMFQFNIVNHSYSQSLHWYWHTFILFMLCKEWQFPKSPSILLQVSFEMCKVGQIQSNKIVSGFCFCHRFFRQMAKGGWKGRKKKCWNHTFCRRCAPHSNAERGNNAMKSVRRIRWLFFCLNQAAKN